MRGDAASEFDYVPFDEPYPEMTGIDSVDIDNVREWLALKEDWEATHGKLVDIPPS